MGVEKIQTFQPLGAAEGKRCPDGPRKGKLESENIQKKLVVLVDSCQMGAEEREQGA